MAISSRKIAFTSYGLGLALLMPGALMGALALAGLALSILLTRRVSEPLHMAHGRYQIRTIGTAVLLLLLLALVIKSAVGPFLLLAIKLWVIYRTLHGAYRLSKQALPG
ncbi:MAG: hypothetical protein V4688_08140 [Pseudomonadota bacterium]